jgi:hypothetical protein
LKGRRVRETTLDLSRVVVLGTEKIGAPTQDHSLGPRAKVARSFDGKPPAWWSSGREPNRESPIELL